MSVNTLHDMSWQSQADRETAYLNGTSSVMSSTVHSRPYHGHMMNTCEVSTGKSIKTSTKLMTRWAKRERIRELQRVQKWPFAVLPLAMLQLRRKPSARPWNSIRFASQLSRSPTDGRRSCMFSWTLPTHTDIKHNSRENDDDDTWCCRECAQAHFYTIAYVSNECTCSSPPLNVFLPSRVKRQNTIEDPPQL